MYLGEYLADGGVLRVGDDPREPAGVPEPVPVAGVVTDPRIDPAGQRVAYVADGALYVTGLAGGTGRLLAAPEHGDVSYGLAGHVAAESMARFFRGYWWAPDGRRLLAARVDNPPAPRWWITDPADLDRGRVGIRGWSHGGALAAIAVIRRPDVFHAAVSGAAPHDQRLYGTHWRERFLGQPQQNPEGYDRSSTMTGAASLTRPLLLQVRRSGAHAAGGG
jgi:Prolyl oligopeptidase family/Dipeptidyl peptidase IV (DPP IV) N-terminal region